LERACRENRALIWLTGCLEPDHNTLWRFWQDNRDALRRVFGQSVRVAVKMELVGLVVHAVDGTKVEVASSRRGAWHREDLQRALERLDDSIGAMMAEVEKAEQEESGEDRLPEAWCEAKARRAEIEAALAQLQEAREERVLPAQMEARMMATDGGVKWAYNAQVAVDGQSDLIVAADVDNQASDAHHLVAMIEAVQETVGAVAEETVADGSYARAQQIAQAEERGWGIVVNVEEKSQERPFHASKFTSDAQRDVCLCPRGEVMVYETTCRHYQKPYPVRIYRCHSWRHCPVRAQCSRGPKGRVVEIRPYHQAVVRQREKLKQAAKRLLLRRRKGIVERLFGWVKHNEGFRRWTFRGLEKVRAQWTMLCLSWNLRRLYTWWREGRAALA